MEGLVPVKREAAERSLRLALSEIEQMSRESKWADILAAFHPVSDKLPEVADHKLDVRVREKIAFALGHLGKFDEAITELGVCVQREPDNFHVHSSLAYTAYDSLYAAKDEQDREDLAVPITLQKSGGLTAESIASVADYLVWYSKDKKQVKARKVFRDRNANALPQQPSVF